MKALMVTLALLLGSCGPIRNMMSDEEQKAYDAMLVEEAVLKEEIATAPPEAVPALEEELSALQVEIAKIEGAAVRHSYGPIWGVLTELPVVGPYLKWAGPFAGTLVIPLLSKRGRKHYWSMVKNVTPGVTGADGTRGPAPISALLDMARAFGIAHSSEASKAAASAPAAS